jgi:amino-acid N-acetyltransferase
MGWGRRLVETVLGEATDRGISTLYLRTCANGFFARLGFRDLPKEDLGRIWEGCSNCPRLGTDECRQVPMIFEFTQ